MGLFASLTVSIVEICMNPVYVGSAQEHHSSSSLHELFHLDTRSQTVAGILTHKSELDDSEISQYLRIQF